MVMTQTNSRSLDHNRNTLVAIDPTGTNVFPTSEPTMFGDDQHTATPSSLMAELTSWGEFDSLVTAGNIGGLDYMFLGDPSRSWEFDMENNHGRILLQ
jgi:hypothetical protein